MSRTPIEVNAYLYPCKEKLHQANLDLRKWNAISHWSAFDKMCKLKKTTHWKDYISLMIWDVSSHLISFACIQCQGWDTIPWAVSKHFVGSFTLHSTILPHGIVVEAWFHTQLITFIRWHRGATISFGIALGKSGLCKVSEEVPEQILPHCWWDCLEHMLLKITESSHISISFVFINW